MGKGEDWKDSETECLIAVWREPTIQLTLNSSKRNIHVYQQISETLKKVYGIDRSGESCRSKVKNMKSWYKREKDKSLVEGLEHCKENHLFNLMEEILFGDPLSSGMRPLFQPNLFPNLNKHGEGFSSGKDDFKIKAEIFSNSDSEQESLDVSNDKDENYYSENGIRNAEIDNCSLGETTLPNVEKRETIQVSKQDHIFIPSMIGMEVQNSSQVNNNDGIQISHTLLNNTNSNPKTISLLQNQKYKQNFQMKSQRQPYMLGRCRQINNTGVRNKIVGVGTNNFHNILRKQARRRSVPRGAHLFNKRKFDDHSRTTNSNKIRHVESKNSDFPHNQNQFEQQLCDSSRENHIESSKRIKVAKKTHPDVSNHETILTGIANKLTELADKLIESEKLQLLVKQKEADVELQRQENEKQRIANEKQRIAMEEIQRREDREHHYRVMQLVLGRTGPMGNNLSSVISDAKTGSSVADIKQ